MSAECHLVGKANQLPEAAENSAEVAARPEAPAEPDTVKLDAPTQLEHNR